MHPTIELYQLVILGDVSYFRGMLEILGPDNVFEHVQNHYTLIYVKLHIIFDKRKRIDRVAMETK